MRILRTTLAALLLVVVGGLATASCGSSEGACDSTGRYCGDGYTEQECDDRDRQQVNGERWFFHAGQTCADRGKASTS